METVKKYLATILNKMNLIYLISLM